MDQNIHWYRRSRREINHVKYGRKLYCHSVYGVYWHGIFKGIHFQDNP